MINKKEEVRKKIIERCPDILDLTLGCIVLVNLSYEKREALITRSLDTTKNMFQWIEYPYPATGRVNEYCTDKSKMEIIGHPITLTHVLRAFQNNRNAPIGIDMNGYFLDTDDNAKKLIMIEKPQWDMFKNDLEEATDEMIEYLYSILINKNV